MNPVDTSSTSHPIHCSDNLSKLPAELLIEIAEHVVASHRLATLASFNVTCRRIHHATLPALFQSMILVTRDPEDCVEVERGIPVTGEAYIPRSWQHVKYLSVGKNALDTLTKLGDKKRQKTSDKGPLETLFPRLVVVFFRMSDLESRNYRPKPT
ncbi:hypothetical protein QFC20_005955 [Naganishia adeliensis]|uniref:Uncharacterized protein n=1 Tax=Naganishia adeliensis TaxID=92952 RepID=A0ACC2VH77_9TREE|nr:hypothetical protein QFC20_005955 [Naganishia adeliensis]